MTEAPEELTPEDVDWIRATIRELASATERLVRTVTSSGAARPGTPAFDRWDSLRALLEDDALDLFVRTHNTIHAVLLAAADHAKSFVAIAGRPGATLSTATLTRGVVEALAKDFYILDAADGAVFAQRYIALLQYELNVDDQLQNSRGELIDVRDYLNGFQSSLEKHGIPIWEPGRAKVNITNMVKSFLDAAAPLKPGQSGRIYSQLSAIAHGNTAGIGMYVQPSGEGARLGLPRELVIEQAVMIRTCLLFVTDRYVKYFSPSPVASERWDHAKRRADQHPMPVL